MNDEQDTALMPQEEMVEIQIPAPFSYRGTIYEPDDKGTVKVPRSVIPHLGDGNLPVWIHPGSLKAAKHRYSHFGGLLVRWHLNKWSWASGELEPEIRDLTLNDLYPNVTALGQIEIPVWFAHHFEELRWVVNGDFEQVEMQADYRESRENPTPFERRIVCSQPSPKAYEIPKHIWDEHVQNDFIGPIWPAPEHGRIMEKARFLGWKGYEE
jgi:hypothetical protein